MLNKIDVLSEIARSIQELYDSGDNALMHTESDILSSIQNNQEGRLRDGLCPAFAAEFGTGSLLFSSCKIEFTFPDMPSVLFVHGDFLQSPQNATNRLHAEDLKAILKKCSIISFTDWASLDGASDLWDRLRTEVIMPLGRNDFEFIFHIGDPADKLSFEVDEIIDIISDFSFNGKVTLILRDREAAELWKLLSGEKDDAQWLAYSKDYKNQYIYNTTNIDRLLIYHPDHRITIFSPEGRQELTGRNIYSPNVNGAAKDHFNAGYILGLLLRLNTIHCTTLGLTVAGAYLRNEIIPHSKALLEYIRNWIKEDQRLADSDG